MGYTPDKYLSKRTRAYRRKVQRKATKRRLENCKYGYKPSLGSDGGGYWKGAKSSKAQKYLKRVSNKRVRKAKQIGQHNQYRKFFDYYYEWF